MELDPRGIRARLVVDLPVSIVAGDTRHIMASLVLRLAGAFIGGLFPSLRGPTVALASSALPSWPTSAPSSWSSW